MQGTRGHNIYKLQGTDIKHTTDNTKYTNYKAQILSTQQTA